MQRSIGFSFRIAILLIAAFFMVQSRAHAQSYPGTGTCSGTGYGTASNPSGPTTGAANDMVSTSTRGDLVCNYSNFASTGVGCYALVTNLNVTAVGGTARMNLSYTAGYNGSSSTFTVYVPFAVAPNNSNTYLLIGNTDPTTVHVQFNVRLNGEGSEDEIDIGSVVLVPSTNCSTVPPPPCVTVVRPYVLRPQSDFELWADV